MKTKTAILIYLLGLLTCGVYMAVVWAALPDRIPTHWGISGQVDAWSGKAETAGLFAGLWGFLFLLLVAGQWLSPKGYDVQAFRGVFNLLMVFALLLTGFLFVVSIQAAQHQGWESGRLLVGGLCLFFMFIGNLLGKVKRNFFMGIRTPWTLASEQVWARTHRVGGRAMVLGAALGLAAVILNLPLWLPFVFIMATALYPVLYSLLEYKKVEKMNAKALLFVLALLLGTSASRAQHVEHEVKFLGYGGFELQGTFLEPKNRSGNVAGVLLLPGSGPTDRNGNQPPAFSTNLLREVAEGLASRGIASLRFDKRAAHVYSGSWPKEVEKLGGFFSWEAFVSDASKALQALREQKIVDKDRVAVFGHSEGGMIALELALQEARPYALILAGTPGRPLLDVLITQVNAGLERSPLAEDRKKTLAEQNSEIANAIVKTGVVPEQVPVELAALYPRYLGAYLKKFLSFDPYELARRVKGPVLVVQGEKDIQILADKDMPRLLDALKQREGEETASVLIKDASHNLKPVADPNKDPGIAGSIAGDGLKRILDWAVVTLARKG